MENYLNSLLTVLSLVEIWRFFKVIFDILFFDGIYKKNPAAAASLCAFLM